MIIDEVEELTEEEKKIKQRRDSYNDDLINFDDGVELSDVTSSYKDMISSLGDFQE